MHFKCCFSNYLTKFFKINFFSIILVILFGKDAFCKDIGHINKSLRLQVKIFLKENLTKCSNATSNEALSHLFNGLSLYNDYYRFGGILDYCREIGMVSKKLKNKTI